MKYTLKHFDTPLLTFTATQDTSMPEIELIWINEEKKNMLPLDLECSPEDVSRWLRHRTIPKNRAYVQNLLSKCGLSINRPMSIISVCKGLSLNDCYWVVEEGYEGIFEKVNLYDNPLSQVLAAIAFTGYGSSVRSSLASSPEFTTNGMLPKCWRRIDGKILLFKGGTSGASNTGNEPYSEFYAAQIAKAMGIEAIPYGLSKWKGNLCSTCELFTSKDYSYVPVGRLITRGGMEAVKAYYKELGPQYEKALRDMIVFDAIVCNTDRHFGNFGFLVDNRTNQIVAPAPLFDHGNALFNYAGNENWAEEKLLEEYISTLMPCVYDDFIAAAKREMTAENREQLRHLLTFSVKKHSRYNLTNDQLDKLNKQIRKRAQILLND
ncbi:MAG: XRE family transcriptional regulator [Clostridia bacterium]|nr:XRE family transcriptional regulator [Clostridia bacterium]